MSELVIIVLLVYIGWKEYGSRQERENLVDIIISKDSDDLAKIKVAKQIKLKPEPEPEPDLIPIDDMDVDSDEFKSVKEQERG